MTWPFVPYWLLMEAVKLSLFATWILIMFDLMAVALALFASVITNWNVVLAVITSFGKLVGLVALAVPIAFPFTYHWYIGLAYMYVSSPKVIASLSAFVP